MNSETTRGLALGLAEKDFYRAGMVSQPASQGISQPSEGRSASGFSDGESVSETSHDDNGTGEESGGAEEVLHGRYHWVEFSSRVCSNGREGENCSERGVK